MKAKMTVYQNGGKAPIVPDPKKKKPMTADQKFNAAAKAREMENLTEMRNQLKASDPDALPAFDRELKAKGMMVTKKPVKKYAGGGKVGALEMLAKKLMPLAEREPNKAKFLESSVVKHPVYHGTGADIRVFDTRKELPLHYTQDETDLLSPLGTHFAKDSAMANNFARKDVENANVHKSHLNLKNPKVFDSEQKLREEILSQPSGHYEVDRLFENPEEYKLTREKMIHKYETDPKFRTIVNRDAFDGSLENSWSMGDREPHVDFITELTNSWKQANPGIDGVIYKNEAPRELRGVKDPTAYIAFEPTQIKSAIGNTGTYNPLDPDITKKRGGKVKKK